MNNPAVNPQEVFRTQLPVGTSLLTTFVPSKDRSSQAINQDYWVNEILKTLGTLFRGATAYPRGQGVWRDDAQGGVLIQEEPVIVFCYVAEGSITVAALEELYRILARMGRETNQGEIGVVLDGKYFGITDFSVE
jgi:hypothetical protein